MSKPDYSRSRWYGANSNNYGVANRPDSNSIDKIVVHVTQGSWSSAINWFRDARAGVSAHYTVRSDDGFIGQSVQEKDIGYHAGSYSYNQTSVGIEHEGYVSDPVWFTGAMYRSSASLAAYLCEKYGIPVDRQHIVGRNEVPRATHTDPGQYWDWPRYMRLIREQMGDPEDGTTKQLTYYRGSWYLRNTLAGGRADKIFSYGGTGSGTIPLMGDWNGDGTKTPGVFRDGTFYLKNSNSGGSADIVFSYGKAGDTPIVGDWNGDGKDTVGIVRGNIFYLKNTNTGGKADTKFRYGKASDTPIVGDWNGDGKDTVGIVRGNIFYLKNTNTGGKADTKFRYGKASDTPIVGDWNDRGADTIGVVRDGKWFLRNRNSGGKADIVFSYGGRNHTPLVWKYKS